MKIWYKCKQLYKEISRRDKLVFVAVLLLFYALFQLGIKQICGFTVYPDEFGYWANAARIIGWDWSEIVSLGSYYSFGYSFLLVPILYFAPDSITAYQMAIFINMLFMCLGYVLLCMITEKLFGNMPRTLRYLTSGVAVLYPAWIFYMQMTLTEALLMSLFVLVIYLFVGFIDRTRVLMGILLAVALVYFYVVHMRTVGTILACGITLFLWGITNSRNRKYGFIVLGLIIIAFIGAFYIKELVQQSVYMNVSTEKLAVNDYIGKIGHIRYLFSAEGFGNLISHLTGKIVYWGVATLGLIYWAFAWMICRIVSLVRKIKNRQECGTNEWFALFLFLTSLAQVAISSLFYIHGKSLDVYMNGRYIDYLVPVLVMTGLYYLYICEKRLGKTILFSVLHITLSIIMAVSIWDEDTQNIRGYFQIAINWLLSSDVVKTGVHLIKIALVGVLFLVFMLFLMWLIQKKDGFIWLFSLLMLIEIGIAYVSGIQYSYYTNNLNYRQLLFVYVVEEKCIPNAEIYYLDDGSTQWIDFIQMQLRERSIKVVTEDTFEQKSADVDILFAVNNERNKEKYSSQFDKYVEESLLILFYNTEDEG